MFFGSNIKIGTIANRMTDEFTRLLSLAQIPGLDLPITTTRTGSRQSAVEGGADVAANETDLVTVGGIPFTSSMDGATNLVDTDLSDGAAWSGGAKVSVVDVGNGEFDVMFDGTGAAAFTDLNIGSASLDRTATCMAKIVSGSIPAGTNLFVFRGSFTFKGTSYNLENLTSEYQEISCHVTSADATDQVAFRLDNATPVTIRIKLMRAVDSAVKHPAFIDDTAAGEAYGTDLNACSPTWPSEGYAVIPLTAYGWSDTGNPADAQPIIFEAGTFTVFVNASGFYETSGGAISTKKPADGVQSIIIVEWDGVNHTISVDNESPVSSASAIVPSGDLYIGNTAGGTKVAHSAEAVTINSGSPTTEERETWNSSLTNIANSITFK
jgi:hypothetical protein